MTTVEIERHNRMVAVAHAIVAAGAARGSDRRIAEQFGLSRRHVARLRDNLLIRQGRLYRKVRKGVLPVAEVEFKRSA